METSVPCTTALHPCKAMSVETVERVGTEESSTSSSSSTDEIPERIRQIFEGAHPEDWFQVYFLTSESTIMARTQWLFEGRERTYRDITYAEGPGTCTQVVVVFKGKTNRTENYTENKHKNVLKGEPIRVQIKGDLIP